MYTVSHEFDQLVHCDGPVTVGIGITLKAYCQVISEKATPFAPDMFSDATLAVL